VSDWPTDPRLEAVARELTKTGWACAVCDATWHLAWVSPDLKVLLGEDDETKLGYGKHLVECFLSETWAKTITPESRVTSFFDHGPAIAADTSLESLSEAVLAGLRSKDAAEVDVEAFTDVGSEFSEASEHLFASGFDYVQGDLPPLGVASVGVRLRDSSGVLVGIVIIYNSSLGASVLAMLARGDPGMYGRMARLYEPGRRQAAILFADLQESFGFSRKLPSSAYFGLVRAITTAIDDVVVAHQGIVGKHAGDGVTAFFLAEDLGSSSSAARAAIEAARDLSEAAGRAAKQVSEATGLFEASECKVNVGVHWGGTLYMGQLVTGGRLEITALGDEVNECARIQQSAREGTTLGSKILIEHLSNEDARALRIDPDGVVYRTISELGAAPEKSVRDAGSIPVTVL
jgi:class 3 adenylate cyclase